jgi:nuclear transport factor 2 (NTF2) superfamily protein
MARLTDRAAESIETRPPLPPFTLDTATQKVRAAEDGWNTRDPERVALAYSVQSRWRNRLSSSSSAESRSWRFSVASGTASSTTD